MRLRGVPSRGLVAVFAAALLVTPAVPVSAQRETVLGLAIQDEPAGLDPQRIIQLTAHQTMLHIYQRLVYIDEKEGPKPYLAESWQTSEGGRVITFRLRRGHRFHDGTPVDAQAVAFTFNRILDPATRSPHRGSLGPIRSVEALDDATVRFTFERPFAPILTNLALAYMGIVSPTAVRRLGDAFMRNPVGSGPFRFDRWVPGSEIHLVRNEHYIPTRGDVKIRGPVAVDRLVIRIVPEEGARVAGLETGTIHVGDAPLEEVFRLQKDKRFNVVINKNVTNLSMIEINPKLPPTNDIRVRRAIAHAVNIRDIAGAAYSGLATPNPGIIPPAHLGYDPALGQKYGYKYDPAKVRELLTEAGYKRSPGGFWEKDGKPLTLVFWTYSLPNGLKGGTVIQSYLRRAGFDVRMEVFEVATVLQRLPEGRHNINFMWWAWPDPIMLSLVFKCPGWKNGYCNPELDRLLAKADEELDVAKRKAAIQEAAIFLLKDAGVVPICFNWGVFLTRADTEGIRTDGAGFLVLEDARIKR
ncbi:MAG: ABC transporter substrate-binding protein [Armatimonadota bacterium]|nr:ABC transporter substrate-binding protein [Armatimonadota bacterium]